MQSGQEASVLGSIEISLRAHDSFFCGKDAMFIFVQYIQREGDPHVAVVARETWQPCPSQVALRA
jgi:hypothetical protein